MPFFLLLSLVIAVVLVLFAVQNSAVVTITFLNFRFEGSLAVILVIVFAFGFLAGMLFSIPPLLKKSSALREQRRRVRQLEESKTTGTTPQSPAQDK